MPTRDELFTLVTAQRERLLDTLDRLPDTAWSSPTLCEGWTVHHVLAHLVSLLDVPVRSWVVGTVRDRGFDQHGLRRAAEYVAQDPAALIACYRPDRRRRRDVRSTLALSPSGTTTGRPAEPDAPYTPVVTSASVLRRASHHRITSSQNRSSRSTVQFPARHRT